MYPYDVFNCQAGEFLKFKEEGIMSKKAILGLILGLSLSFGSFCFAETPTVLGEYLIRVDVQNPTVDDMSIMLGVEVKSMSHIDENLYKITIDKSVEVKMKAEGLSLRQELNNVARAKYSPIISIQPNFIYTIALARSDIGPQILNTRDGKGEKIIDNPPFKPAESNPASGTDTLQSKQWGLQKSKVKEAWAVERGTKDFVVAVIDTGVDYNHEDLRANMWHNPGEIPGNGIDDDGNGYIDDVVGWDFIDNDAFPYDKMSSIRVTGNPGHGTHCSGVIGAVGDNAKGTSGVVQKVSIMALRFINDKGEGTSADAVKALRYAMKMGVKVVSNSWGGEAGDEDDSELKLVAQEAEQQGVILVFAAGNGRNGVGYNNDTDRKPVVPGSFPHNSIIAVAAMDVNDGLGVFSNFGVESVDIGAPGVHIMSTVPLDGYEDEIKLGSLTVASWDGTSMATPHVAGAVALTWIHHPNESAAQIKQRILNSATPVAALNGKVKTGGILNVLQAIK